jgi:copper homeostasis protein
MIIEACVETFNEAVLAEKNGADRLELCSRLDLDGLTPDKDLIAKTVQELNIPVKVMIRPRSGNFIYSKPEIEEMKESIRLCKKLNVMGVVFGILTEDYHLDLQIINSLSKLAYPMEVTIHKAIDQTTDIFKSVLELTEIEYVNSILSSGGNSTAIEGKNTLMKMISLAKDKISIIAAGKITKSNLFEVHRLVGANEYHGRKIVG